MPKKHYLYGVKDTRTTGKYTFYAQLWSYFVHDEYHTTYVWAMKPLKMQRADAIRLVRLVRLVGNVPVKLVKFVPKKKENR